MATITQEDDAAPEVGQTVEEFLFSYNKQQAGHSGYRPLVFVARDEQGNVIGGLKGATYWGWLYVDVLAVEESHRRGGIGTSLLRAAETEALRRGCRHSHLDTFSFQALPFYAREGYTVFGVLDDFPGTHRRFFLRKTLAPAGDKVEGEAAG